MAAPLPTAASAQLGRLLAAARSVDARQDLYAGLMRAAYVRAARAVRATKVLLGCTASRSAVQVALPCSCRARV